MQKKGIAAFFARLVLSVVLVISFTPMWAFADTGGTGTAQPVAKIVNQESGKVTYYDDFADAFEAATNDETIIVTRDVELTSTTVVPAGTKATLNLHGYAITAGGTFSGSSMFAVQRGATLTIQDEGAEITKNEGKGAISCGSNTNVTSAIELVNEGTDGATASLTVSSGSITGYTYGISVAEALQTADITINGGTIKGTATDASFGIYLPQGKLTLTAGTVEGATGIYTKAGTVSVPENSTVTVKGVGTKADFAHQESGATSTGDAFVAENCGTAAKIEIKAGTFNSAEASAVASYAYTTEGTTPENVAVAGFITGGKFNTQPAYKLCGEDLMPSEKGEDGYYTVGDGAAVASVGEKYFTSFADALAAITDNSTVTMYDDVALDESIKIANAGVVLDLNGHTIKASNTVRTDNKEDAVIIVKRGGELTINDSSKDKTGKVSANSNESLTCAIKVTYTGETDETVPAKVTINGGTIEGTCYGVAGTGLKGRGNTEITINGGTITAETESAVYQPQKGKLVITGGTIEGPAGVTVKSGTTSITGGTIISTEATASTLVHNGDGVTPNGSALIVGNCSYPGGAPTIEVTGGTFKTTAANATAVESYAYGSTESKANEAVEKFVSGGTFASQTPYEYCAAGYIPAEKNMDGVYTVEQGTAQARIGEKYYETFEKAFAAVGATDVIVLVEDVTPTIELEAGQSFTYYANGKTFTNTNITAKDNDGKSYMPRVKTDSETGYVTYTSVVAVAKIGTTKYETLADAIAAAPTGEEAAAPSTATTITLLDNCEGGILEIPANKNIVIDLGNNEYEITSGGNLAKGLFVNAGAKLVLQKGSFVSTSASSLPYLVWNEGDLTIDNVKLQNASSQINKYDVIAKAGTLDIKGESALDIADDDYKSSSIALNIDVAGNPEVTVKSGDKSPAINGKIEITGAITDPGKINLDLEGGTYTSATLTVADDASGFIVKKASGVTLAAPAKYAWDKDDYLVGAEASITTGDAPAVTTYYATFEDAYAAAKADNKTIKLLANVAPEIELAVGASFTFNPNGFTLTATKVTAAKDGQTVYMPLRTEDKAAGTVTYKSVLAAAQIGTTYYASLADAVAAVTVAEDGALPETATTIKLLRDDTEGAKIAFVKGQNIVIDFDSKTYTIKDSDEGFVGFDVADGAKLELKGGTLTTAASSKCFALVSNAGDLTVNGTILSKNSVYTGSMYTLMVTDGTAVINNKAKLIANKEAANDYALIVGVKNDPKVTVNDSTVQGKIVVSGTVTDPENTNLKLEAGTYTDATLVVNANTAGFKVQKTSDVNLAAPAYYGWNKDLYLVEAEASITTTGPAATTYYATFEQAFEADKTGANTIKLLKDVEPTITLAKDQKFTYEANGKTFSAKNVKSVDGETLLLCNKKNTDETVTYYVALITEWDNELKNRISDLEKRVKANEDAIDDLKDVDAELGERLGTAEGDIEDIQGDIADINDALAALTGDEGTIKSITDRLDAVEGQLDGITGTVADAISDAVKALEEGKVKANADNIAALLADVAKLKTADTELAQKIINAETAAKAYAKTYADGIAADLQSKIDSTNGLIKNLQETSATKTELADEVAKLNKTITDVKNELANKEAADIADCLEKIADINATLNGITGTVVDYVKAEIKDLKDTDIANNVAKIQGLQDQIDALNDTYATDDEMAKSISEAKSALQSVIDDAVEALNKEIKANADAISTIKSTYATTKDMTDAITKAQTELKEAQAKINESNAKSIGENAANIADAQAKLKGVTTTVTDAITAAVEALENGQVKSNADDIVDLTAAVLSLGDTSATKDELTDLETRLTDLLKKYAEESQKAIDALEDQNAEQAAQIQMLLDPATAKTAVTYNTATVSWTFGAAEGVIVNGTTYAKGTAASKAFSNLNTGSTYTYTVVPYMTVNGKVVNGKTVTVTAKPSLTVTKIKKAKAGTKKLTVKWNKVAGANGYQLKYKVGGKTKTINVTGAKKVIKKLKSGKKVKVYVKAYRVVNGKYVYSGWSKVKTSKAIK